MSTLYLKEIINCVSPVDTDNNFLFQETLRTQEDKVLDCNKGKYWTKKKRFCLLLIPALAALRHLQLQPPCPFHLRF